MVKAFVFTLAPFVIAEAVMGISSSFIEALQVPSIVSLGMPRDGSGHRRPAYPEFGAWLWEPPYFTLVVLLVSYGG